MKTVITLMLAVLSNIAIAMEALSVSEMSVVTGREGFNERIIDNLLNQSLDEVSNPEAIESIIDFELGLSSVLTFDTVIEGYRTELISNPDPNGLDTMNVHFDLYALRDIRTGPGSPSMGNIEFRNVDVQMNYRILDLDLGLTIQ